MFSKSSVLWLLSGVAIIFTLQGPKGFETLVKLKRDRDLLKNEDHKLSSQILEFKNQIFAIKTDPKTIEKLTRSELKVTKPGEILYPIVD